MQGRGNRCRNGYREEEKKGRREEGSGGRECSGGQEIDGLGGGDGGIRMGGEVVGGITEVMG